MSSTSRSDRPQTPDLDRRRGEREVVGQQDALRLAGGPRRVDDRGGSEGRIGPAIARPAGPGSPRTPDDRTPRARAPPLPEHHDRELAELAGDRSELGRKARSTNATLAAGVRQDVDQRLALQGGVDRALDRAQQGRAEDQGDMIGGVARHLADDVPGPDAELGQDRCDPPPGPASWRQVSGSPDTVSATTSGSSSRRVWSSRWRSGPSQGTAARIAAGSPGPQAAGRHSPSFGSSQSSEPPPSGERSSPAGRR